jgi:hypothetical protein
MGNAFAHDRKRSDDENLSQQVHSNQAVVWAGGVDFDADSAGRVDTSVVLAPEASPPDSLQRSGNVAQGICRVAMVCEDERGFFSRRIVAEFLRARNGRMPASDRRDKSLSLQGSASTIMRRPLCAFDFGAREN